MILDPCNRYTNEGERGSSEIEKTFCVYLTLTAREPTLVVMKTKVDPHTVRVELFLLGVDP